MNSPIIVENGKFDFVIDVESGGKEYEIEIQGTESVTVTDESACYASGSLIRTTRGDVAVEALEIGDIAVAASGQHRAIRWLGHRTVDCRRHPNREAVMPIRIAADAFGPGKPERDLVVSPGHAICITLLDEALIPACLLVNGATVARMEVDEVTYWHVELDSHDVLLANGLPAESYNDVGNRGFFVENATVDLAMAPDDVAAAKVATCHPYIDGGPVLAFVRERMRARAVGLGWSYSSAPFGGLRVVADGVSIEPQGSGMRARFVVPATAEDVRLVSPVSAPCDILGNADTRGLGVSLAAVTVSDGLDVHRMLDLAACPSQDGFHPMEAAFRWTKEAARLPTTLWAGCEGVFFLTVDFANPALPRWSAPATNVVPLRQSA